MLRKLDLEPTTTTLITVRKGLRISQSISEAHGTVLQLELVVLDSEFCEEVVHEVKRLKSRKRR